MRGGYLCPSHQLGIRGGENGGLVYGALLSALPFTMTSAQRHEIALNVELVVHAARPATMLESADHNCSH